MRTPAPDVMSGAGCRSVTLVGELAQYEQQVGYRCAAIAIDVRGTGVRL